MTTTTAELKTEINALVQECVQYLHRIQEDVSLANGTQCLADLKDYEKSMVSKYFSGSHSLIASKDIKPKDLFEVLLKANIAVLNEIEKLPFVMIKEQLDTMLPTALIQAVPEFPKCRTVLHQYYPSSNTAINDRKALTKDDSLFTLEPSLLKAVFTEMPRKDIKRLLSTSSQSELIAHIDVFSTATRLKIAIASLEKDKLEVAARFLDGSDASLKDAQHFHSKPLSDEARQIFNTHFGNTRDAQLLSWLNHYPSFSKTFRKCLQKNEPFSVVDGLFQCAKDLLSENGASEIAFRTILDELNLSFNYTAKRRIACAIYESRDEITPHQWSFLRKLVHDATRDIRELVEALLPEVDPMEMCMPSSVLYIRQQMLLRGIPKEDHLQLIDDALQMTRQLYGNFVISEATLQSYVFRNNYLAHERKCLPDALRESPHSSSAAFVKIANMLFSANAPHLEVLEALQNKTQLPQAQKALKLKVVSSPQQLLEFLREKPKTLAQSSRL